ncbi:hypothetical protein BACCIP111895_00039 [Neobacillus rhizosphaerae]|uniref:Uncharacterized protein n=1 Tax=Neobacillus rhizosphaerae TaxID=2880965 RepID=A0ABN8KHK2_9BACI|nr:hypothetical protein BACCIP111895_00039 [Neobacillus rhizosphaerae]
MEKGNESSNNMFLWYPAAIQLVMLVQALGFTSHSFPWFAFFTNCRFIIKSFYIETILSKNITILLKRERSYNIKISQFNHINEEVVIHLEAVGSLEQALLEQLEQELSFSFVPSFLLPCLHHEYETQQQLSFLEMFLNY